MNDIYDIYNLSSMEIPPAPIVTWRNGASCLGSKGEKDGRRPQVFWLRHLLSHRPSFSPATPSGAHHSAANVVSERNLRLTSGNAFSSNHIERDRLLIVVSERNPNRII